MLKRETTATLIGWISLLMWSSGALVITKIRALPILEITTILFSISFLITSIKLTACKQWQRVDQPWPVWLTGAGLMLFNNICYIGAFHYAPAAEVDLIEYLWPILTILISGLILKEKVTLKHFFACLIGFFGVYGLIMTNHHNLSFNSSYVLGYIIAFAAGCSCALYNIFTRYLKNKTSTEMVGMYFGLAAIPSLILHLQFEKTVIPSMEQSFYLIAMGIIFQCCGYFMWDYGMKHGHLKLLSVLSYFNPILSISLLVLFKEAEPTNTLTLATVLVASCTLIISTNKKHWQFIMALNSIQYLNNIIDKLRKSNNEKQHATLR